MNVHHRTAKPLIHQERNKVYTQRLYKTRQVIDQHINRLIRNLPITRMRLHMLHFILLAPRADLVEPVNSIAEAFLPGGEFLIADLQGIAQTLPVRPDCGAFHLRHATPLVSLHEADWLGGEETERVEHVVLEDLAAGAVALVQEFGPRDGCLGALGAGLEAHEFAD